MIQFHELRVGDIVLAEYEGQRKEGEIIELNREDKEVNVQTGEQDFWYSPKDLYSIPLDESQLTQFGFEKQAFASGEVKYLKGPFRILLSRDGDFSHFEMWYREDRRHITQPLSVHALQNHYHQMTKIDLARAGQPY
ncbi:MAG: hypothetical protein JST68_00165 [Bacteroidetes bacterium]|nr:hypothetical protein [Bacteroidota bacterium]